MFPQVIRVGHARATIYSTPTHGKESFTVVHYEGSSRKRKSFASLDGARLHATTVLHSLANGEAEVVRLSGEERLAYVRANAAIAEFGQSMDTVAFEYRDAKRILRGASLLEAARFFAAQKLREVPRRTVSEVFREMVKAKRDAGLSERYLGDLEARLGRFSKDFQCQIAAVSGGDIKEWVQAMEVANRTRNNFRLAIQTLFAFAKAQKYLPPDWNELEAVPVWKTPAGTVEIFRPQEMSRFLGSAVPGMIPFLAIAAFAGLRTAEIQRLDWSKVNLSSRYITVDAAIAKTNSRRLVPITPNLADWLKPHARLQGAVLPFENIANAIQRLVASVNQGPRERGEAASASKLQWRHNALRHSFCSYRLADVKNAAQVALEAGNSPAMIFKHYRELVTDADAMRWFSIRPDPASPAPATTEMSTSA